jgi:hypothetical protein
MPTEGHGQPVRRRPGQAGRGHERGEGGWTGLQRVQDGHHTVDDTRTIAHIGSLIRVR